MKAPITAKQAWVALAAIYGWPDDCRSVDGKADASELQLSYDMALSMIETLQAERDEYRNTADTMAAAHKVERDALHAELEEEGRLHGMDMMRVLALNSAAKMALESLEAMTRYCSIVRLGESRLKDTETRGDAHVAIKALQEALK